MVKVPSSEQPGSAEGDGGRRAPRSTRCPPNFALTSSGLNFTLQLPRPGPQAVAPLGFSTPGPPLCPCWCSSPTFALPVGVRGEADVPPVLAVELGHQRLVGVADQQDGRVEGLDLLLAALVGLDADGPPAAPVVPLALEPCRGGAEARRSGVVLSL